MLIGTRDRLELLKGSGHKQCGFLVNPVHGLKMGTLMLCSLVAILSRHGERTVMSLAFLIRTTSILDRIQRHQIWDWGPSYKPLI